MKRLFKLLTACIVCVLFAIPALGAQFQNPPLIDDAGYLTESQALEISEILESVRQEHDFDVAVVTEYHMTSHDAMSSADDIYDFGGFGAGADSAGIMLYICADTREYHITTHADYDDAFNDNAIEYLKKEVQPHLEDDEYYLAMEAFAYTADELLEMAEKGKPYDKKQYDIEYLLIVIGCALILPLVIAFILMKAKLKKMKTAVANEYAANYIKPGSKRLEYSRDVFLYSHITKTERPKNNSGKHVTSSGRTHGGGGGSF